MEQKSFAIAGDTQNPQKYAAKIKNAMLEAGYKVFSVGKELSSFNEIQDEIDIIDLCINAKRGLELVKDCKKSFKCIVIQPGAESDELLEFLDSNKIPYIQGCLLVGLSVYKKAKIE